MTGVNGEMKVRHAEGNVISGRLQRAGRVLGLALLLSGLASSASAVEPGQAGQQAGQRDPRRMTFEPVQFHPPEPERVVFDNGLVVYLLEDHELPLVTVTATMRTGSWLDPAGKVGLATMAGVTMRTGGTLRMSAEQVDAELEQLAAQVTVSIGTESGAAVLDVLKKDLPRGLRIFGDILMTPAFDQGRVELAKLQALEGIRRRQDQPQSIAAREFAKLIYGADHPFARESTVADVKSITPEDLRAFHARTVHPNGIILGVTGDFEQAAMLDALRETFGTWQPGQVPAIQLPPLRADQTGGGRVVRVIGKGSTQTHLRVGHLTIRENDPDYPAVSLLNDILGGGGFRSRLFQDIRTKRGLAYSVGSGVRAGVREDGVWLMRAETKLASTQEVVSRLVANMERLQREPVSDQELAEAKEAFVNSFVFSFTSASSVVNRLIGLEYDGLPKDFLQQLRDKVVKLTKEDLQQAARKHLHPEQLRILAVGPGEALPTALSSFGEVKEIKLPPEG